MTKQEQGNLKEYIRSKDFRYTLVAILVFLGIFLLVSFLWLRLYTHHGQELAMPDYTGFQYEDAVKDAKRNKFRMSIQDSLHILGKPGGEILKQNPAPGSLVKSKRMIYVTITKRSPDKILSSRLPEMYGKSYERKKRELEEHFEIKSRIVDTKYDPGDAGQVLEVRVLAMGLVGVSLVVEALPVHSLVSGPFARFFVFDVNGVNGVRKDKPERVEVAADRSGCSGAHGSVPVSYTHLTPPTSE